MRYTQVREKRMKHDEVDLITLFQSKEKQLKESFEKCDVLFNQQNLDSLTFQLCEQEVQKQAKCFQQLLHVFKQLNDRSRGPYKDTIRKYKLKTDRYQRLIQKNTQHRIYIEEQIEIWEEEFQRQSSVKVYVRGICGVIGAFILHLLIGANYRWALVNVYITSFYKITEDPFLLTRHTSIGAPISMLAVGLTMKPALEIGEKMGKIPLILISIIFLSLSTLICSWMPTFPTFLLVHNFAYGFFSGLLFLTSMSECQKYFPSVKLYINSIILVGTGLGSIVFGKINTQCLNPNNLIAPSSGYYSGSTDFIAYMVPFCFRKMAIYVLGIGMIGWLMITPLLLYNSNEIIIEHRIRTMKNFEFICKDEKQALQSAVFWKIALIVVLCSAGNFFMVMNFKKIPSRFIHNEQFLNFVVLSGVVCNGLFRFAWGFSLQRLGFKWVFLIAMILNMICFGCMPFVVRFYYAYLVVYSISGIVIGGLMVIMPNLCLMVFGDLVGNQMFGYIWVFFTIANFIQFLIGSQFGQQIQHSTLILIFMGSSMLALIIGSCTTYQGRWENSLKNLTF